MSTRFHALIAGIALLLGLPAQAANLALGSPWWENYDSRDSFLCRNQSKVIIERNDAQAALIAGRSVTTLFRETSTLPGVRYGNDSLRVILRGDELTVERLPMRIQCLRMEQV